MKINEKEAEDGQFEKSFKKYFAFYLKLVESLCPSQVC